jgi:hypothetical protein
MIIVDVENEKTITTLAEVITNAGCGNTEVTFGL